LFLELTVLHRVVPGRLDLVGRTLAHYKITAAIGAGGMGEVYRATDTKLGREIALKVLPPGMAQDPERLARFRREARSVAALNHPHIVTLHSVEEADGYLFLTMELVEGRPLSRLIPKKGFPVERIFKIALAMAEALAEAHSKGIVHRDLKPSNVMETPEGRVKVLDFGLAKELEAADGTDATLTSADCTRIGDVVGTPTYMSPEQVAGRSIDNRTDIFSLGIVLYEMATGQPPFQGQSRAELASAILRDTPQSIGEVRADLPADLVALIQRCLQKDSVLRYQTMRDLKSDLERIRANYESGQSRPVSEPITADGKAKSTRPGWRWRGIRGFTLAGVLLTVVIIVTGARYVASFRTHKSMPASGAMSTNPVAYDAYMRGKVNVSSENPDNNEAAIKLFEQSVAKDPNFAAAYAELARAYNIKARYFAPVADKKKLNEEAEIDVEKALALDPRLAEGHFARGLILWTPYKRFPHEQAIESYRRALELNPNLDEAHHQLGFVYLHIGMLDKAWVEIQRALAINPGNTLARYRLGVIDMCRAQYEEAFQIFNSTPLEKNPSLLAFYTANALFRLGRNEEASAMIERFFKEYPHDEGGAVTSVKAMMLAKAGKKSEAEAAIQHAIEIGRGYAHFHHTSYNIASAYALMNQPEPALKWLEVTADEGFPCYPLFKSDANLDNLRKDPRFVSFMAKQKQQWEHYSATL
jgi:serine/threonine protein kinase/Tfp pilus assembly protein PilF